jgi:two-component system cell cycle response regulator CtrA
MSKPSDRAAHSGQIIQVSRQAFERQRERIEELEEENRQLREQLVPALAFPRELRLTPSEHRVLAFLYARAPAIMSKERIHTAIFDRENDAPEVKIIDVFICKIRVKLARCGVDVLTTWGTGYSLPLEGKARLALMISGEIVVEDQKPELGPYAALAQTRERRAARSNAVPALPPPQPIPERQAEAPLAPADIDLTPLQRKAILGFRAAGNNARWIARQIGVDLDLVRAFLAKREAP